MHVTRKEVTLKKKNKIILPDYCGLCGADLEGGMTCSFCGEQVIYSEKIMEAYTNEIDKSRKRKQMTICIIAVGIVVILFVAKDLYTKIPKKKEPKEAVATPVITQTSGATATPVITQTTGTTATLVITQTPGATATPVITQTTGTTATPIITKTPRATAAPVITKVPKTKTLQTDNQAEETEVYAEKLNLPEALSIKKGNKIVIPLECSPNDAIISIISSNNSIIGISGKTLNARNPGSCEITVKSGDKAVTCKVIVTE